jgi:hypothetical protein
MSIPTTLEHLLTTDSEKRSHRFSYNEDGSFTGVRPPVADYYTYEGYNGSHGFSDLSVLEMDIGPVDSKAMQKIHKQVLEEVKGMSDVFTDIPDDKDYYAIETVLQDRALIIIALAPDIVTIGVSNDFEAAIGVSHLPFRDLLKSSIFMDVHAKHIAYVPTKKMNERSAYIPTYTPSGIIRRYKNVEKIVFNRLEEIKAGEMTYDGIAVYELTFVTKDDDTVEFHKEAFIDDKEYLVPIEEIKADIPISGLKYTFYSSDRAINVQVLDTEVAARNKDCAHYALKANSLPGQKADIIAVKSMANIMLYSAEINHRGLK